MLHYPHFPHDLFPTRHRPNLNEEKWEGEPATAETEDRLGFPEFGQFPVTNFLHQVPVLLEQMF